MTGLVPSFFMFILLISMDDTAGAAYSHNGTLYQGDIMLTDVQRRIIFGDDDGITKHSAIEGWEWPNGEIPYMIGGRRFSNNDKEKIRTAMKEFEDKTCIKFVPKRRTDKYYINIKHDGGCSSYVGRVPEGVKLNGIRYDPRYGQPVQLARYGCMYHST